MAKFFFFFFFSGLKLVMDNQLYLNNDWLNKDTQESWIYQNGRKWQGLWDTVYCICHFMLYITGWRLQLYLQVMIFIGHFIKHSYKIFSQAASLNWHFIHFYLLIVPFDPHTPGKTVLIFTKGSPYFCMGKLKGPGNEASLSYADLATAAGDTVYNIGLSIQR